MIPLLNSIIGLFIEPPQVGSNAHLKQWLLENPTSDIDTYIHIHNL